MREKNLSMCWNMYYNKVYQRSNDDVYLIFKKESCDWCADYFKGTYLLVQIKGFLIVVDVLDVLNVWMVTILTWKRTRAFEALPVVHENKDGYFWKSGNQVVSRSPYPPFVRYSYKWQEYLGSRSFEIGTSETWRSRCWKTTKPTTTFTFSSSGWKVLWLMV